MIDERIFLGFPIKFKDVCKIYPPTVNEVIYECEDFYKYQSLLIMSQEELDDAYANEDKSVITPTPFQYFLASGSVDEKMKVLAREAVEFFVKEPVTIIPELKIVFIGKHDEDIDPDVDFEKPRLLTEENFFEFQNLIRVTVGAEKVEPPNPNEDPRVKRIKAKGRKRERAKAKRQSSLKIGTLLAAICCMGIGLNPLNIGEMSYANVPWLIQMYKQQESFDIDIKSLLAGADSKKVKPKYWIKNLD